MKDDEEPEDELNAFRGILLAILFSLPFWAIVLLILFGVFD